MKYIDPYTEIIESTENTINSIYKSIELAGRVSHKSEDKITTTSAVKFVNRMIQSKHLAVLEFGTVYLTIPIDTNNETVYALDFYQTNPYSRTNLKDGILYVTTNYRVLYENLRLSDLQYLTEISDNHEKRITIKFVCSRAISHELVRHRIFSFMQESQRFCNYSKDSFGKEITFIKPLWYECTKMDGSNLKSILFDKSNITAEKYYFDLLALGLKAEEAREVLPNCTKTELYMCGFESNWKEFFKLRCSDSTIGKPHPEMTRLCDNLRNQLYNV